MYIYIHSYPLPPSQLHNPPSRIPKPIKSLNTNEITTVDADALYIFIGAKPYTDWLCKNIITNGKGFIETGRDLNQCTDFDKIWKSDRDPYLLETSCPGIFAAGDVREHGDRGSEMHLHLTAEEIVACECVGLAETKDHMDWQLLGKCAQQLSGTLNGAGSISGSLEHMST